MERYEFHIKTYTDEMVNEIRQAIKNSGRLAYIASNSEPGRQDVFYEELVEPNKSLEGVDLKPGDVVRLKSGGPIMTVCGSAHGLASVVWYCEHAHEYIMDEFDAGVLKKIEA